MANFRRISSSLLLAVGDIIAAPLKPDSLRRRVLVFVCGLLVLGGFFVWQVRAPKGPEPAMGAVDEPGRIAASGWLAEDENILLEAMRLPATEPAPVEVVLPLPEAWRSAPVQRNAVPPPTIAGLAAVVVDEASGAVLFDKDAHVSLPPASLTKIATAILALEMGDLDAWVEVDVDSRLMRSSTVMGLSPGDRFRLRDLLYGLMLPSGNDAALAIGRHLAGSDAAFVAMMNDLSRRLGLRESTYANPHGLGSRNHAVSAYDLAMLSRYAMSVPGFKEIVSAPSWTARGSRTLSFRNINTFLFSYSGADGIKTGYTRSAGQTIATSATRNGERVYVVVLNSSSRDDDARRLLNWVFANFTWPAE
jgi:serine-type D-Ala-D-Ala carboxypeptidase (penicillin-binding protein 5/6)